MRNTPLEANEVWRKFAEYLRDRTVKKKQMNTGAKNESPNGLEVSFEASRSRLTIGIGHIEEGNWSMNMEQLMEVEQYMISCDKLDLVVRCRMLDDTSTLMLMHVLKMAERYQWLGNKEINVDCNLGLGKSNRYWIKEKLRKHFDLDIRFSGLLTGGVFL